jgi:hypothetical protein
MEVQLIGRQSSSDRTFAQHVVIPGHQVDTRSRAKSEQLVVLSSKSDLVRSRRKKQCNFPDFASAPSRGQISNHSIKQVLRATGTDEHNDAQVA